MKQKLFITDLTNIVQEFINFLLYVFVFVLHNFLKILLIENIGDDVIEQTAIVINIAGYSEQGMAIAMNPYTMTTKKMMIVMNKLIIINKQ